MSLTQWVPCSHCGGPTFEADSICISCADKKTKRAPEDRPCAIYDDDFRFLAEVQAELKLARKKFPTNEHRLAALVEEVGEVSHDLMESKQTFRQECVQVAVCALRLAVEGDRSFKFSVSLNQAIRETKRRSR